MRFTGKHLTNERGSIALFTVFLLGVSFVAAIVLFYVFSVHTEKRQSQNIADAVALAAADVLGDAFTQEMMDSVAENLLLLNDEIDSSEEEEPEPSDAPPLSATPDSSEEEEPTDPPKSKEDKLRELLDSTVLVTKLMNGTFDLEKDWILVVEEPYFADDYTARKNGDRLYDAFLHNAGDIEAVARQMVDRNKGERSGTVISFPMDGEPALQVDAFNKVQFEAVVHVEDVLGARSASSVSSSHFNIDVSMKTVKEIRL
ncbi:pilus assembly protein TadG-related protein [Paenibacillus glycanilyticus]|uniref:Putative Flp pilus-assembly TadG-like N-terminal domain-containing protein n=1 Tax=Paenibacillus glycanilyticus TaxID=126569 RepID=A0ABQ6GCP5_9BACL|nr:pilus assembly protein TadG-related protein [Paenibacillus glycanilyticus]GLX68724.1 hypothetical protein MU1_30690 [Paenibacillus glycanilyticus]